MFSRFFAPKPDAVAYELLGVVTGLKDVKRGGSNMLANQSAGRLAGKINQVLTDPDIKVDGATARYLETAMPQLKKLGAMPSSVHNGRFHPGRFGPIPLYDPHPAWEKAFTQFRQAMAQPTAEFVAAKIPGQASALVSAAADEPAPPRGQRPGG